MIAMVPDHFNFASFMIREISLARCLLYKYVAAISYMSILEEQASGNKKMDAAKEKITVTFSFALNFHAFLIL